MDPEIPKIAEAVPAAAAGGAAAMAATRINAAQGAVQGAANAAGPSLTGLPAAAPNLVGTLVSGGVVAASVGGMAWLLKTGLDLIIRGGPKNR